MSAHLYLASGSPRRRALLRQIGFTCRVLPITVDERLLPDESPEAYVTRLARAKAEAGLQSLGRRKPLPVLGADTAVVVDDDILGKPRDRDAGIAMLLRLSGRAHRVLSAVAVSTPTRSTTIVQESHVHFRPLTAAECLAYWHSGEPCDKAGGYGIQGRAAVFITALHGSYSGVMGLPLYETAQLLATFSVTPQN